MRVERRIRRLLAAGVAYNACLVAVGLTDARLASQLAVVAAAAATYYLAGLALDAAAAPRDSGPPQGE